MLKCFFPLFIILSFQAFAGWQEEILETARKVYAPVSLKEFNKPLIIKIAENDSISGSADHGHDSLIVEINTGVLKAPRLNPDALRMLVCHELGHLFGGDPKKDAPYEWEGPTGPDGRSLLSAEGQADFFAGLECFRKLTVKKVSSSRIAKAGLDFLNLVKVFPIAINTQDLSVTPKLIRNFYPSRQCRLDTIVLAARGESRPDCWYK
jgi:hypothetical protein